MPAPATHTPEAPKIALPAWARRAGAGALPVAVALVLVLVFFALRNGAEAFLKTHPDRAFWVFGGVLAFALAFRRVGYEGVRGALSMLTRGTGLGVLLFLIVERPDFIQANPDAEDAARYVALAWVPALACAALSFWRPAFLIPAAFYAMSTRTLAEHISYFGISYIDILYLMDMGQYLALSIVLIAAAERFLERRRISFETLWKERRQEILTAIAFLAIGLHLANYLWSGAAKLKIEGDGPLTWIFENPTHYTLPMALFKGALPIGSWPALSDHLYNGFAAVVVVTNATIVVAQLFAGFAVTRKAWLVAVTVFYDLFHIGIYVLGGLFFWPWVWNNLTILATLKIMKEEIAPSASRAALLGMALGLFPALGNACYLAWYDIRHVRSSHVEAETDTGARVKVPSSFFLSHSFAVSQNYLDIAPADGHYPFTIWGSAPRYVRLRRDGDCPDPALYADEVKKRPLPDLETRQRHVSAFIKAAHGKMFERSNADGRYNPYLRAHHHPSNPLLYRDFNALDMRRIRRYHAVTESVCVRLNEGRLAVKTLKREEYPIELSDDGD